MSSQQSLILSYGGDGCCEESRDRRWKTSLYPSPPAILAIVMIVPLEKLTATEPYDAVRSKPTPKVGCSDVCVP